MKSFLKVVLLVAGAMIFYLALSLLTRAHPLVLSLGRILLGAGIIIGGILILRKHKHLSHRLPKEKEKEHEAWYKSQFNKSKKTNRSAIDL